VRLICQSTILELTLLFLAGLEFMNSLPFRFATYSKRDKSAIQYPTNSEVGGHMSSTNYTSIDFRGFYSSQSKGSRRMAGWLFSHEGIRVL